MTGYNDESIAEMNIYENLVNLARLGEDVLRVFNNIVYSLKTENDLSKVYNKIRDPKARVEENKILFMEYLARLGEMIMYKQNYASIALDIERLTQLLDGASYRLSLLKSKNLDIDNEIYRYIEEMKKTVDRQYECFLNGLRKIRSEPKKTLLEVSEITKLENTMDELYREATLKIYMKFSDNILLLMMLKDIFDFIENASDLLKSMGEELRYLALHKVVA